jgi:hypothetical protein
MALMAAPRTPVRRRQRSVRVTVAVTLLSVATAIVLVSTTLQSLVWLMVASAASLVLAWAALRTMWTEVLQARRDNAADRAAAAAAYRNLFAVRAGEHASFTTAMTERLASAHLAQRELEGLIVQHETRAQRAESRLVDESAALEAARERMVKLEQAVIALRAEDDSVVDLVAWDEKAAKKTARKRSLKQA